MAAQWFYTTNKQQMGPVSWDELRQLASSRLLGPDDLVWSDGMAEWVKAERQQGLFATQEAAIQLSRSEVEEVEPAPRSVSSRRRVDDELDDPDDGERRERRKPRRKKDGGGFKLAIIIGVVLLVVLVLGCGVIGILAIVFGGRFGDALGAGTNYTVNLAPGTHNDRVVPFRAGQRVRVTVTTDRIMGPFQPDVDLFIMLNGALLASDVRVSPDCDVTFVAPANGAYVVRVNNLGPGMANSRVAIQ